MSHSDQARSATIEGPRHRVISARPDFLQHNEPQYAVLCSVIALGAPAVSRFDRRSAAPGPHVGILPILAQPEVRNADADCGQRRAQPIEDRRLTSSSTKARPMMSMRSGSSLVQSQARPAPETPTTALAASLPKRNGRRQCRALKRFDNWL
jgi:hypothetical protein